MKGRSSAESIEAHVLGDSLEKGKREAEMLGFELVERENCGKL
jgi:hypothetical protein